nr:hypothetical protein [Tanacetum cinerariifolium]
VVQIVLWYLDSGCSKHMTRDRSQLTNFVRNDHVAKIIGYGDYQIGNVMISRVYYVEGLGYNLFPVGKFCDSNLECVLQVLVERSTSSSLLMITLDLHRTDNGAKFVNQTLRKYYENFGISHETSVARSLQQNGFVERCNQLLSHVIPKIVEAARTMLIYAKALLFLWPESIATTCYTQNHSIIRLHHGKTPYELLHDKLSDLSYLHVHGALCYPMNDSENLDFDELIAMAYDQRSVEPALHEMTPATISSGLVPPSRTDWDLSFQPMFDDYLILHPVLIFQPLKSLLQLLKYNSQTSLKTQSPVISNDVEQENHDLDVAHMNNDPFFGIIIPGNNSEASFSDVIPTIVHTAAPNSEHVNK